MGKDQTEANNTRTTAPLNIREFFTKAIAFNKTRHPKPLIQPRKPNRRTKSLPPESDHELIWRMLNKAIRLMDVPEMRQDAQWWQDRDEVLFAWDKLLRVRKGAQIVREKQSEIMSDKENQLPSPP